MKVPHSRVPQLNAEWEFSVIEVTDPLLLFDLTVVCFLGV